MQQQAAVTQPEKNLLTEMTGVVVEGRGPNLSETMEFGGQIDMV